jgi:O-antigen/teichoic acid export membrane protein
MRLRRTAWMGRSVTLADQVLSSVSNLLVVVLVARAVDPTTFGQFVLGYSVLTLTLGLSRAYFGSRVSLAPDLQEARRLTGALVAGMLVLSPLVALAVLAVSTLATNGQAPLICAVVAVATPIVCVQDVLRFGAAAGGRPAAALLSDGAWILVMAVPFALSLRLGAVGALILWAGASALALSVALIAFRERPRWRAGVRELRRRENVGASLTVGAVATMSATLLVLLVVSNTLGPAAAGSLRGASTAMGPVNVLLAFTALGITPMLVRRARHGDQRFCTAVAAVLVGLVLAWGALLLLLPERVGTAAFGSSWAGIRSVVTFTVVEYVFVAVGAAAFLGLKVRQRAGDLIRSRTLAAAVTVVAGAAAAGYVGDVVAVAAGLAVSALFMAATAWFLLLRDDSRTSPVSDTPIRPLLHERSV